MSKINALKEAKNRLFRDLKRIRSPKLGRTIMSGEALGYLP